MKFDLTFDALRILIDLAQIAAMIVLVWWNILVNKTRVNKANISDINQAHLDLKDRVTVVEAGISNLSNHEDINFLYSKVNDTNAQLNNVQGQLKAINKTLGLINEHLIRDKG